MSKYDRIKVLARIRPLNNKEISSQDAVALNVSSGKSIDITSTAATHSRRKFELDAVLDENTSQDQVFEHILPLLESSIEGYNCTIFTYGQTGTGKTYTMLGYDLWGLAIDQEHSQNSQTNIHDVIASEEEQYGVVPKTMKWLLSNLQSRQLAYQVSVSYLELYNDIKIIDLLDPGKISSPSDQKSLEIRENKKGEIIVPGLTRIDVRNSEEVLQVLWNGARCRSVAATDMNDYSSRSHTVFMVYLLIESTLGETRSSKICLVDLAGSEKWKSHQLSRFSEARIAELKSINRSLSALGNCISALLKPNRAHIPYRDSKLTRLLQDSLGGNTQTLFIVTLSPSLSCSEETVSTLQFADRAMKVQVVAKANKVISADSSVNSAAIIDAMKMEIHRLQSLLQLLLRKFGAKLDLNALAEEIGNIEIYSKNTQGTNGSLDKAEDFDVCISQELIELRDENFDLLKEIHNAQEELSMLKEEKRKILKAIFEHGMFVSKGDDRDKSESTCMLKPIHDTGGESADTESEFNMEERNKLRAYHLQYQVLESQREELDVRKGLLDEAEDTQEARWNFLQQYHEWLRSQAAPVTELSRGIDEDVYRRVCLMEASVLLQADELQRAKKKFLTVCVITRCLQVSLPHIL